MGALRTTTIKKSKVKKYSGSLPVNSGNHFNGWMSANVNIYKEFIKVRTSSAIRQSNILVKLQAYSVISVEVLVDRMEGAIDIIPSILCVE